MPSSVKIPWSQPIANPVATRVPPNIIVPETVAPEEWPFQWSWYGLVNAVQIAPSVRLRRDRAISVFAWNFVDLGTSVSVNVTRNGSAVLSQTMSVGTNEVSNFGSIAFTAGQRIGITVTAIGDGTSQGLWIGIA